jgi:protein O-mannosyl-transferase
LPSLSRKPLAAVQQSTGLFASAQKRNLILALLIFVATLAIYNPVNRHPFVNYDDDRYVVDNPNVHGGLTWPTISWAFTTTEQANWHPLTWLSHVVDYQLFHANPAGHHFTSLVIHSVNAALLFLLLAYATGRTGPSLFVAALFALHPINVESVAWVAERKNVLSTFFFFLSLGAYGWYAMQPTWRRYLAVFVLFAMGLMSKPMVITLPFVLLLLDCWPLQRMKGNLPKLIAEKIPLFILSAASAIITMRAQQSGGAMRSTLQFSLWVRLENAVVAYAMYLWKMLWPTNLAPLYPHPGNSLAAWQVVVSSLALLAITALVVQFRSQRYLVLGWLWFLGTLIPVIGLIQVGDQAMADRYAYIPLIGIFIMLAYGSADLVSLKGLGKVVPSVAAACILVAFGFTTVRQLGYWADNYELWAHTLKVTQNNFIAEDNLGGALVLAGKTEEAYPHFQAAAAINPRDPMSHSNLGAYLQEHNHLPEAIEQYQTTISLANDPALLSPTYSNLGTAYRELGDDAKAEEAYKESLRLNPGQYNACTGMGRLRERQGNLQEAISYYSQALALRPTDSGYVLLGHALQHAGKSRQALDAYNEALRINPESNEAQSGIISLSHQ